MSHSFIVNVYLHGISVLVIILVDIDVEFVIYIRIPDGLIYMMLFKVRELDVEFANAISV